MNGYFCAAMGTKKERTLTNVLFCKRQHFSAFGAIHINEFIAVTVQYWSFVKRE